MQSPQPPTLQRNLDQERAAHALKCSENIKSQHVERIPGMIVNNGLLATAAFCLKKSRAEMMRAMDSVADHLKQRSIVTLKEASQENPLTRQLINDLANKDSESLHQATDEALAYLAFLKRFAKRDKNKDAENDSGKEQA